MQIFPLSEAQPAIDSGVRYDPSRSGEVAVDVERDTPAAVRRWRVVYRRQPGGALWAVDVWADELPEAVEAVAYTEGIPAGMVLAAIDTATLK